MTSDGDPIRVACIVGVRPNFMKMAPILRAFAAHGGFDARLIHTGQHYDRVMNAVFFEQLALPEPDLYLGVGSGTQIGQTARIMLGLEAAFRAERPEMLVVVGDVTSTLAATLVGAQLRIPVAHVEAGLRSFDREMPEEINRLVTDRLSDLLLTTDREAGAQLIREGAEPKTIRFVGNVMIDTLRANLERAVPVAETLAAHAVPEPLAARMAAGSYGLVTLHRPSNVDDPVQLAALLAVLGDVSGRLPMMLTLHPRTRTRIAEAGLDAALTRPGLLVVPPLGYLEMLGAMRSARVVITDSGGLQEETTALGVPCLTVRANTERPITITEGTNTLVGRDPEALRAALEADLTGQGKRGRVPELWDGQAAPRIVAAIADHLCPGGG